MRIAFLFLSVLALDFPLGKPSAAQDENDGRLEQLQSEISAQRQALGSQRAQGEARLKASRAVRQRLAQELLQAALQAEHDQAEVDRLEDEATRLEGELRARLDEMQAVQGAAQSALERMGFSAAGIPGREAVAQQARAKALHMAEVRRKLTETTLSSEPAPDESDELPELGLASARTVFSSYGSALQDAARIQISTARIFTASGREEEVRLLSAGWVAYAYRCLDGRLGLALASPIDASGYRWSEDLDQGTRTALGALFDRESAGHDGFLPVDVTGQVRPESLTVKHDLKERLFEGGPLMVPLGLVALAALLLCSERFAILFLRNRRSPRLAHRVLELASAGQVEAAREMCASSNGILPRTLAACLARSDQGQGAMEDGIQEQLLNELPRLSRFLRTLAILASVAPLIGLLGTVTGIIQTFGVIKALGTTDPTSMAGGISVALVTTAVGLSIAIPTLLAQGLLKGRGERLIADTERYAASLLTLLVHGNPAEDS